MYGFKIYFVIGRRDLQIDSLRRHISYCAVKLYQTL